MLRRKITKTAFDALPEDVKKEYRVDAKNDQEYLLDVDDASELTRALEREKKRADDAETALKPVKDEITALNEKLTEAQKGKPDIEALERSWAKKLAKAAEDHGVVTTKLTTALRETLVDGNANALAAKISTSPTLLARYIKDRLTVETEGDKPVLRILDVNGKPSAGTLEELEKEILANKEFSGIVIGSKASGGSAPKSPVQRPGSAKADLGNSPPALSVQKPKDLVASLSGAIEARRAAKTG